MNSLKRYFQIVVLLFFSSVLIASSNDFLHESPTEAKLMAQELKQNMLVYFSADWCLPCQLMEDYVLNDTELGLKMKQNFVLVKASYDQTNDQEWFSNYSVSCLPTISVMDKDGDELDRVEGYITIEDLNNLIDNYLTNEIILDIAEETDNTSHTKVISTAQVFIPEATPELLVEEDTNDNFFNEAPQKAIEKENPPTLIGIKEGVKEDQNSFYKITVSKKTKSKVPAATNLKEMADAPSRGTVTEEVEVKTVSHSVTTASSSKAPLRTPITGKIISTKRSNVGIQFGAFGSYDNALKLTEKLAVDNIETIVLEFPVGDKVLFKVLKLGVHSMAQAKNDIENYNRQGIKCFLKLL